MDLYEQLHNELIRYYGGEFGYGMAKLETKVNDTRAVIGRRLIPTIHNLGIDMIKLSKANALLSITPIDDAG